VDEPVRHDPILDQPVRSDDLHSQGTSTYRLAAQAVQEGRFTEAAELGRFLVDESREGREMYPVFMERAREFLLREGISPEMLAEEEERILALLRLPDGLPFDADQGWADFDRAIEAFVLSCEADDEPDALEHLEQARLLGRRTHDRACDRVYGLVDVCSRHLGEDRVVDVWDHMMADVYPTRDRYATDKRPWSESVPALVLDAVTSLRGHWSGPDRLGDVEIDEQTDRWVLRFDPCGSGGRTTRADRQEGTPARTEPPYGFGVTTEPHDWAWNERGVCLYCVHCCQLQERIPIERLGHPVRVVDPPLWPAAGDAKCTWTIYKDVRSVPDAAYRRVGARKPPQLD
jgi:hypothetical protein